MTGSFHIMIGFKEMLDISLFLTHSEMHTEKNSSRNFTQLSANLGHMVKLEII